MSPSLALVALVTLLSAAPAADESPPAPAPGEAGEPSPEAGPAAASDDAEPPAPEPPPPPPPPGAVEGVVKHAGRTPLRVKVLTNTVDVETCGERVSSQALVIGRGNTLGNVVIELRSADDAAPSEPWRPGDETLELSLRACSSDPHVAILAPGTRVEVVNPDHLHHEIVTRSVRNVVWEERLPRYQRRVVVPPRSVARPEAVRLACERHPFMSAWWWITDNPRHALTAADGAFRLPDVPPGRWVVHAWHEELGELEKAVDVVPGAVATVTLEYR